MSRIKHQQQYGETIDKCITDLVIKVGTGIVVGGVFSLLFSRKRWPLILGSGVGIGMAYTACENRLRFPELYNAQVTNPLITKPSDLTLDIQPLENKSEINEVVKGSQAS